MPSLFDPRPLTIAEMRDSAANETCRRCGRGWCPTCGTWHHDEAFEMIEVELRRANEDHGMVRVVRKAIGRE